MQKLFSFVPPLIKPAKTPDPSKPLYSFVSTNRGALGQGVLDEAFHYPFEYPETWFVGPGNYNRQQLSICAGNPSYYQLSVTNAPATGPGNLSGIMRTQALTPNFYNPGENTAYF
jgi:hypothetical protein